MAAFLFSWSLHLSLAWYRKEESMRFNSLWSRAAALGWALAFPFFAMHTDKMAPIAAAGAINGTHARRARNCEGIAEPEPTAGGRRPWKARRLKPKELQM